MNNFDMIETNELSEKAIGGSELMLRRIYDGSIDRELLDKVQIIPSRIRHLKEDKHRIFLANDLPNDPESKALSNGGWGNFHKLVFVSHWQRDAYVNSFHIPYSRTAVIHNAIEFDSMPYRTRFDTATDSNTVNLIYHTTPHRGLSLLVPVFEELYRFDDELHLDVYSSFEIYGWAQRDEQFKELFDRIRQHPGMTYHGFKPNAVVRSALQQSDIFAYPCIWPETFCISLVEAMAHGCLCVHPNFAALPETAANWTSMYNIDEDQNRHMNTFTRMLDMSIGAIRHMRQQPDSPMKTRLLGQMSYASVFYNWAMIKDQWQQLLRSVIEQPLEIAKPTEYFVYDA